MGGAHSHRPNDELDSEVEVPGPARWLLVGSLIVIALLTVGGVLVLWPADEDAPEGVDFLSEGVTRAEGRVVDIGEPCPAIQVGPDVPSDAPSEFPEGCNQMQARVVDGPDDGETVTMVTPPYVSLAGIEQGDPVRMLRIPERAGSPTSYAYVGIVRDFPLGLLAVAFVIAVALVARTRGILALVGLGFAAAVMVAFILPALLAGESGIGVALTGSALIMYVVLYLAHGVSIRTSTALAGTMFGIAITALIGLWGVGQGRLSGVSDETGEFLAVNATSLDFQGLLPAAIIIAGLGVLNDVTITQSSSVWEIRAAAPTMSRRALFTSGMRIGRDHIASSIYTIVFVYAGSALALLLLLSLQDRPLLEILSDEAIAEEIVRTMASAIGLVLAVPATTAIAALTVARHREDPVHHETS